MKNVIKYNTKIKRFNLAKALKKGCFCRFEGDKIFDIINYNRTTKMCIIKSRKTKIKYTISVIWLRNLL